MKRVHNGGTLVSEWNKTLLIAEERTLNGQDGMLHSRGNTTMTPAALRLAQRDVTVLFVRTGAEATHQVGTAEKKHKRSSWIKGTFMEPRRGSADCLGHC